MSDLHANALKIFFPASYKRNILRHILGEFPRDSQTCLNLYPSSGITGLRVVNKGDRTVSELKMRVQ